MSLSEIAASNPTVANILADGTLGHRDAFDRLHTLGVSTSETSVRRSRRKAGWVATAPTYATTEAVASDADPLDPEEVIEQLRRANNNLSRKLSQLRSSKAEYVAAVYEAASSAISGLEIAEPVRPTFDTGPFDHEQGKEEIAFPLVSDLQLAKVTPEYSSEIAEERMEQYAEKIVRLTDIQRKDHPVKHAVVPVLGDIIEGIEIFPGQQWLVDAGLYRQIMVDGPRIMTNFFQTLLTTFETIEVVWVIGNHGRIGRKGTFDPETNGDRMLGKLLQMMFANHERIQFTVPDGHGERNWYAIAKAGNYSALCLHGDQIRGHSGIPWYGFQKKINSWAAGAIPEQFKDVFMGHFHQGALVPLNKRDVYVNGSTESYNTFAQEQLAAMSDPSQWLLYVDPTKGVVTSQYKVRLD